jgi:hypothetical protein
MASIHDNPERALMIKRAIVQTLAHDKLAPGVTNFGPGNAPIGLVAQQLPADFDLLDEELGEALAELTRDGGGELPEIEPLSKSLKNFASPRANGGARPSLDTANATPGRKITREQSQQRVEAAHAALGDARVRVQICKQKLADSKAALAKAILVWQREADPMTPEQRRQREARNFLAATAAEREGRRSMTAHTAKQFVQKRMLNGPQRGAYSMAQAARVGFKMPGSK